MGHKKVCLNCRKAFNQNADFTVKSGLICPECGQKIFEINHKFRPPKKSNLKAWEVSKYLIENGFLYQRIYQKIIGVDNLKSVSYPTSIDEAKQFVKKYKDQAILQ